MELDSHGIRILAAASATAPALALLLYFSARRSWRHLRELARLSFGFGFGAAIPIAGLAALYAPAVDSIEGARLGAAAIAFLEAAAPEETGKFLVLMYFLLRHEDLRRPVDAVVLSVMVSVGFAAIENIYYVFGSANWTETAMLRAITAVPMHATVGLIMGCFAAQRAMQASPTRRTLAAMLLWPVVFHGAYNYPVFAVQRLIGKGETAAQSQQLEFQILFVMAIVSAALFALIALRSTLADRRAFQSSFPFEASSKTAA